MNILHCSRKDNKNKLWKISYYVYNKKVILINNTNTMSTPVEAQIQGTRDLFPEDHKYLTFLKKVFRHEFRKNGFRRIATPSFEDKTLLRKAFPENRNPYGVYTFTDKQGNNLWLCPNANVGTMRAYLSNEKYEELQPLYYYYMEKFLRQSREQKETFIIGGEIIGETDPIIDAQMIYMTYISLHKIWLTDVKIEINSYGNEKEMTKYREYLSDFYTNKQHLLTPETAEQIDDNILSVFHSDNEDEQILAWSTNPISKFLKKDSKAHFEKVKEYLTDLEVPFVENHTLFFKEEYYTNTIWTIHTDDDKFISRWGRYNNLSQILGSQKPYPAAGFAIDAMVLVDYLKWQNLSIKNKDKIDLYFVQLGDEPKKAVLPLSLEAREKGINTMASLWTPSMKEQILKAQRIGARFVVLVGIMEARNGIFQVRDIESGTQEEVKKEELIDYVIEKIGKKNLDFYEPSRDLIKWEPKKEAE